MHIAEGTLSGTVLGGGFVLSAIGTAIGLAKLDNDEIPRVAILSSMFFVVSLIHIPVGVSSEHLILNGLSGLLLGWAVFPAIMLGLLLQALLFQFGGFTTLGVNTLNLALPGLICYYLFGPFVRSHNQILAILASALSGIVGIVGAGSLVTLSLFATDRSLLVPGGVILLAHIPVMIVEAILTILIVQFLRKVKPEALGIKKEQANE